MIEELANRIWQSGEFQRHLAAINSAWLQSELEMEITTQLDERNLTRCVQAATFLSQSADPEHQRAAYSIGACASDLWYDEFPGVAGTLRIILTNLGNFPAVATTEPVYTFHRLPTQSAVVEEARRSANTVHIGEKVIVFTDFQRRLWKSLIAGDRVAVSAPTSAGKSFVLQTYLQELARSKRLRSACYLVPSRALIAQVTDVISGWRTEGQHDLTIINVPLTEAVTLPETAIYVLTQERLQAILASHPNFAPDLIICDEAQSIDDGSRGVLLQNVIDTLLHRNEDAQLIFAGPNIRDLGIFAETFGLKSMSEVKDTTPSVIQNLIVVNTRSPIKGRLEIERFTQQSRTSIGLVDIGRDLPSIRERLIRVSERFGQNKPSIVYANGPAEAEKIALGLVQVFPERSLEILAEKCALEPNPGRETEHLVNVEAAFARLLADHMTGRLELTLERADVGSLQRERLYSAMDIARSRVNLPADVIGAAPTISAIRQQRLASYLDTEIGGGGIPRLEELIPRHPRDPDAWKVLSEVYRVCHAERFGGCVETLFQKSLMRTQSSTPISQ